MALESDHSPDYGQIPRTGIDLCEIDRIRKAIERYGERFLKRIFTEGEIRYCSSRANPYPSYAARFAAKEAVMKLLGAGIGHVGFNNIEVVSGIDGRPSLKLDGKALEISGEMGIDSMDISLTHIKSVAAAVVFALARKSRK